jgi:alkanesulfonate monooxygenase SsuD/methylene tetrahydromethanopterin reductase-like flavin-dependent oxidoreductase (luciferase family)
MDVGLLVGFRNPAHARVPWEELYASQLDLCVAAEAMGYGHIWLTEHHFVDDGYSPSLLPIAAALAARTTRIRIGTFVLLLPLHDPVRVAEDAATVDVISRGRFDLGLGLGYRVAEFAGYGVPRGERGARLEEGTSLIRRLLSGETVDFEGRFSKLRGARVVPPPVQRPHPPIWLAARGEKALDRAARHGFHLASVGLPAHVSRYDELLARHGRKPGDHSVVALRACYVAPTREQAWAECAQALHYTIECYAQWFGEAGDLRGDRGDGSAIPSAAEMVRAQRADFFGEPAIVGTPADALHTLLEYRDRARVTHLALATMLPGIPAERLAASLELFASEVLPKLA